MLRQTALFALALAAPTIAQVTEGFENGWDQTAWPVYATDCNQGGKVTLDSSTAHTGKNSIRVDGAGGFCGHIFVGTTKIPSGDVYVRTYVYVLTSSFSLLIRRIVSIEQEKSSGPPTNTLQQSRKSSDRLPRNLHHHARLGSRHKQTPPHRRTIQDPHVQPRNRRRYFAGSVPTGYRDVQGAANECLDVL